MFETFVLNIGGVQVRREMLEGREHLVVPTVIQTEGVHTGTHGPGLYEGVEIARNVQAWNHKPIVLYHPQIGGKGVSACDPIVLSKRRFGIVLNSQWDGKHKAESWIDIQKCKEVAPEVLEALERNEVVKVSSGIYLNQLKEGGEFNGVKYDWKARSIVPDHLAVLPGKDGADKGAGLLLNHDPTNNQNGNQPSLRERVYAVEQALREKFSQPGYTWNGYVEDVYDGYCVYCTPDGTFKMSYKMNGMDAEMTGDPVPVERVVSYRTRAGEPVGNADGWVFTSNGGSVMATKFDKKAHLDSLVANGQPFSEKDREWLDKLPDDNLQKIKPVMAAPPPPEPNKDVTGNKDTPVVPPPTQTPQVVQPTTGVGPVNNQQVTVTTPLGFQDWLKQQPPEVASLVGNAVESYNQRKVELVNNIVASPKNKFTKEFLLTKDVKELEGIAALITPDQPVGNQNNPPMFLGAFTPPNIVGNSKKPPEPLKPTPSSFVANAAK